MTVTLNTLKDHGISISMDGRGRYLDNIFIERLWRSVKQEKIYRYGFEIIEKVEQALTEYFDYYNHGRLHQSFSYSTPADILYGHKNQIKSYLQCVMAYPQAYPSQLRLSWPMDLWISHSDSVVKNWMNNLAG